MIVRLVPGARIFEDPGVHPGEEAARMSVGAPGAAPAAMPEDPYAPLRTRRYLGLLALAALIGAPVCAVAFGFLALVTELQPLVYTDLPVALGFHGTPLWWPLPMLALAGASVGWTVRHLPGHGGHEPAYGFSAGGAPSLAELPGIVCAALASLGLGAVLGPEAPLIAIGGGLAVGALRLAARNPDARAVAVVGAAGSFAAVSALLGSPLLGAFLLMEVSGLAGPLLGTVLAPGLLAAGTGALIFTGLGDWTGLGTYGLALHDIPEATAPTVAEFGWALAIGIASAFAGAGVRRLALLLKGRVERRRVAGTVVAGLAVAGLAIGYGAGTGREPSEVMYSGETALEGLLAHSATYSSAALVSLVVCKALAYCVSLSAFRGGPIFPAMFVGSAGGILLSELPGLTLTAGFAMGVGAMAVAMLRLPMTSVLLATLLLGSEGLTVMPLVIVAVVIAYVVSVRLQPAPAPGGSSRAGGDGSGVGGSAAR
ncbi:H+/Cl- antiporter ClcA [Streptomyces syringium]|uniref:H+/Cl- antiporter ClcA n=2 Tax=Streptomyces syringium TaxID=76729 RepID=A0ABS4XXL7_9ACTN|nr:H+/Cl- antiporter ClcA [Streptomyces syringium]